GSDKSGDFRMRAVPAESLSAVTHARFVGEMGMKGVNVTRAGGDRVFVQCGDEVLVGAPNEIGLGQAIDKGAAHQAVLAVRCVVVQALDGKRAIHSNG